jgi:hypothetical protein
MTEPSKLTEDEVKSLLVCPECGGQAYSHTDLARQSGAGTCRLNVMESRVAAVEKIVDERIHLVLQPFRAIFMDWEAKLPDAESSDPLDVTLAECIIDLGNLLVESGVLPRAREPEPEPEPVRTGFEGVGGHAPGCDGWRPPTALGFGRTSPPRCIPGCPMARERTP